MSQKKVNNPGVETPQDKLAEALGANANVLEEIEEILADMEKDGVTEDQRQTAQLELGTKVGSIINKINDEEGGKLFDAMRAFDVPDTQTLKLEVGEFELIVNPRMDRFNLYSAISLMSDMMEQEKNNLGYRRFLQLIDEFEFMFFVSFYTNIGYHSMLEGYMKLRDLFEQCGVMERFYGLIAADRAIAKEAFQRLYDLWKDEHIAIVSYIPHAASAGNTLANRILNMLGDELLAEDTTNDVEIQNLLVDMMRKNDGKAKKSDAFASSDKRSPVTEKRPSFQKKDIVDDSDNIVMISKYLE